MPDLRSFARSIYCDQFMIRPRLRPLAVAAVIAGAVATVTLFVPPPKFILRQIALAAAPDLISGVDAEDGRARRLLKRTLSSYVQIAVASHLSATVPVEGRRDEEILYDFMRIVRARTLNHLQFDHGPRTWPMLLTGAGFCDQINAAVAQLAASHFSRTEIYALWDPVRKTSPHTIGRVWSERRKEWLYFDAFWDEPTIYTRDSVGRPHFVALFPPQHVPGRGPRLTMEYALDGTPLSSFPRTFGQFLITRSLHGGATNVATAANAYSSSNDDGDWGMLKSPASPAVKPPATPIQPRRAGGEKTGAEQKAAERDTYELISRRFLAARFDHLFTGEAPLDEYRNIAAVGMRQSDPRTQYVARLASSLVKAHRNGNR